MERHTGKSITSFSKHGSGGARFGWHHHAPYEPEKYRGWALQAGMRVFFGNLEDPTMLPARQGGSLTEYPSAFWLEPAWRDVTKFPVDWLLDRGVSADVVLLIHPENVLADASLTRDFCKLIEKLETKILA